MMVLGIDIGKLNFFVHLLDNEYVKGHHKSFQNTSSGFEDLQAWLKKHGVDCLHACMEASGSYGVGLAEFLVSQGYSVSIVNPIRIRRYAESRLARIKTDKQDALVIALFCLKEKPAFWVPMPEEFKHLQALVQRCDNLKKLKQQEANRLEANLSGAVRVSVEKMIGCIEEQIAFVEAAIKEHIERHIVIKERIALLSSIPGISLITARKLLTAINFANFGSARAVAAFIGLTPTIRESGTSLNKRSRISKTGSKSARQALYMPAIVSIRHNPIIKAFAENLLARGKAKMAIVCAAMRKLLHIAYGVLKSGKPFDPKHLEAWRPS